MKQFLATFLAILAAAGIIFLIREIYFAKNHNDELNSSIEAFDRAATNVMTDTTNAPSSNP